MIRNENIYHTNVKVQQKHQQLNTTQHIVDSSYMTDNITIESNKQRET